MSRTTRKVNIFGETRDRHVSYLGMPGRGPKGFDRWDECNPRGKNRSEMKRLTQKVMRNRSRKMLRMELHAQED